MVVPTDRMRSNYHKLKYKINPNTWKSFFTLRVAEPWNRLLTDVSMESPSLDIFKFWIYSGCIPV